MGHSAGAGIVSLLATDPTYLRQAGVSPSLIKGFISNDTGAYDVAFQINHGTETSRRMYRRAFGTDPSRWSLASPLTHALKSGNRPPAALIITRGWSGRRAMADAFAAALKGAGGEARLLDARGLSHREVNKVTRAPIARAILNFLEATLGP